MSSGYITDIKKVDRVYQVELEILYCMKPSLSHIPADASVSSPARPMVKMTTHTMNSKWPIAQIGDLDDIDSDASNTVSLFSRCLPDCAYISNDYVIDLRPGFAFLGPLHIRHLDY